MPSSRRIIAWGLFLAFGIFLAQTVHATPFGVRARSAIVIDTATGRVLFEQAADDPIPPASVTKILTLYILFDAIREGRIHLTDTVEVSRLAADTGGSRMGLRAGKSVPMEELIKGIAVVSGNDACVAAAQHLCGDVETFVHKMNVKARELGMTNSRFMTPNGLPAAGQVTTARDISKLSMAYLKRFPDALNIHSMQSYTYNSRTHHNANRLLGKCPGVDGIKTGFVCASGYNISATARRGETRILAVVLGAPSPGVRATETAKLLETGFMRVAPELAYIKYPESQKTGTDAGISTRSARVTRTAAAVRTVSKTRRVKSTGNEMRTRVVKNAKVVRNDKSAVRSKTAAAVAPAKTAGRVAVSKKPAMEKQATVKTSKQGKKTSASKQVATAKKNSSSRVESSRGGKNVVSKSKGAGNTSVAQTKKSGKSSQKSSNLSVNKAQKPSSQAKASKRKNQG